MEILLPRHKAWKKKMDHQTAKVILAMPPLVAEGKQFSAWAVIIPIFLAGAILIGGCITAKSTPSFSDKHTKEVA